MGARDKVLTLLENYPPLSTYVYPSDHALVEPAVVTERARMPEPKTELTFDLQLPINMPDFCRARYRMRCI